MRQRKRQREGKGGEIQREGETEGETVGEAETGREGKEMLVIWRLSKWLKAV